jgi:hypothetical protein
MNEKHEQAMEKAKPLTARSDRTAASWGGLFFAMPDPGCPGAKCLRRPQHEGDCTRWPTPKES